MIETEAQQAANWREIPTSEIERVLREYTGTDTPTRKQLEEISAHFHYHVEYADPSIVAAALTFHKRRVILIPRRKPDKMHADLMHEIAEILLRCPVADEFYYEPTGADEFHNVSCLTTERLRKRIRAERQRLLEDEARAEAAIQDLRLRLKQIGDAVIAFGKALQESHDVASLQMPDPTAMQTLLAEMRQQTHRLKSIQAKLHC